MAAPCNEAQRGQAARELRNRARSSGLTRWVKAIEEGGVPGIHKATRGNFSGQPRFPGLILPHMESSCALAVMKDSARLRQHLEIIGGQRYVGPYQSRHASHIDGRIVAMKNAAIHQWPV